MEVESLAVRGLDGVDKGRVESWWELVGLVGGRGWWVWIWLGWLSERLQGPTQRSALLGRGSRECALDSRPLQQLHQLHQQRQKQRQAWLNAREEWPAGELRRLRAQSINCKAKPVRVRNKGPFFFF